VRISTHMIRLTQLLVLGAVAAGTAATVAGAVVDPSGTGPFSGTGSVVGRPPHAYAAPATSFPTAQGLRADGLRLQAMAQAYESQTRAQASPSPGRPPDVGDAAAAATLPGPDVVDRYVTSHARVTGLSSATQSTEVGRPPDVADAAQTLSAQSADASTGFDWGDYGIGIGSGMGVILLLAGGLALGRQQRRRMQTA
jgi:hypothetical protein